MIYRYTKAQIEDLYKNNDALNQSSIKVIIKDGMESFLAQKDELLQTEDKPYYEEKEHYLIGTAVDEFNSFGESYYNDNYYFSKLVKKPSATSLSVIKMVFDMVKSRGVNTLDSLLSYREQIYRAIEEHNYYRDRRKEKWEEDTRYVQLLSVKTGAAKEEAYWADLKEAGNRLILSDTQNIIINSITNSFHNHPFTAKFFRDSLDVDIVFQFPIFFTYEGIRCKGLIDHLYIDHARREIFRLDEKTMWDYVTRFNMSIKSQRYDVQASFYSYGMANTWNLKRLGEIIGRDNLQSYRQPAFAFIVESVKRQGTPLIFPIKDELIKIGQLGDGDRLLGWHHGVTTYKEWAKANFSLDEIFESTKGVAFIDEHFEYVNKIV